MNTKSIILVVIVIIIAVSAFIFSADEKVTPDSSETSGEEEAIIDFNCGEKFDYEGYLYKTVKIDDQCWFAEDLRYDNGCMETEWDYSDANSCRKQSEEYNGLLYQWNVAMDGSSEEGAQGICPAGWHIPTHDEWSNLKAYLSETGYEDNEGDAIKDPQANWCENEDICGEISFLSLPTGSSPYGDEPIDVGNQASYWSSTFVEPRYSSCARIKKYGDFKQADYGTNHGFSVRCIKN